MHCPSVLLLLALHCVIFVSFISKFQRVINLEVICKVVSVKMQQCKTHSDVGITHNSTDSFGRRNMLVSKPRRNADTSSARGGGGISGCMLIVISTPWPLQLCVMT